MKPNVWVSSSQATELLTKQLATWPLAAENYRALEKVETRTFDLDGVTIRVQFNPARIASSGAKIDPKSIRERKCFLCPAYLPMEQERLSFGLHYLVLCNPYPIFPQHFTIPARRHVDQNIVSHFEDFLEITRRLDAFTLFYNGPKCGASAPDHLHFQAVTQGIMPIDNELATQVIKYGSIVLSQPNGTLQTFTHYLRNGFVINAQTAEAATSLFRQLIQALETKPDETEPRMNVFASYRNKTWTIAVIPRRQHRPWQYEAEGTQHLLSSPGAADIGGLFITALPEDFEKITEELLTDVYRQVCLSDNEIEALGRRILENNL